MISNKKAVEAAQTIADYCKQQAICKNCIRKANDGVACKIVEGEVNKGE